MARSEARISVSIWTDQHFLALTPTAQRMFMFLVSQPDLAHDGVIALRERRWSKSADGLTTADVTRDLEALAAARFIVLDEDAEELLIRSFIRRDKVYRQPNVLRAAADHIGVVSSRAILAAIAEELRRIATAEDIPEPSKAIVADMLAAIEKTSGNPSPDPSPNPSGNPSAGTPGERGVVTTVRRDSPSPVPRSSDPVPRASPPATPARERAKRGTRLPEDFAPTPELIAWAREHAPTAGTADHDEFMDYWRAQPGQRGVKTDWPATWRNWMRKASRARPAGALRAIGSRPSTTDQRVAEGAALAHRFDQMEAS